MKLAGGRTALALGVSFALAAGAQESEPDLIEAMADLESQLTGIVVSSTKVAQKASKTPAVVTVVSADEIQARGYTSLADILRPVPGFYDVHDLVFHNLGVRGISGGARANGNVIKVMIDGHPVDFRADTGNFFGEELVPVEAIERVEIIRGPASALYGANAFLGVVNVITRSGDAAKGVRVGLRGNLVRGNPGFGLTATLGHKEGPLDVFLAAGLDWMDRSGLALPAQSPVLNRAVWPPPATPFAERGLSRNDTNRPRSVLARVGLEGVAGGKLSLLATVQNLDTAGEFQDFGTLYHGTRISLLNQNYRLSWEATPHERVSLQLTGHYFSGTPTRDEHFHVGRADSLLLRRVGADGFGFTAEGRVRATDWLNVTVGGDLVKETHLLQHYDSLLTADLMASDGSTLRPKGTITPLQAPLPPREFLNLAAYAQAIVTLGTSWSATVGGRLDSHTLYGLNPNGRLGLVYAPDDSPLSLKLLYGSSFKAPSAVQLFTQPMGLGDIQGNSQLKSQWAHTVELSAGYALPGDRGELLANLFGTDVLGRVEFVQNGLFLQAINLPFERVVGGELSARVKIIQPLQVKLSAGIARTIARETGGVLVGLPEVTNPLFPTVQVHLLADYRLPWAGLRLSAEGSFISARSASQPNAVANGAAYVLPAYFNTAAALSTAGQKWFGDRETSASLRVSNLLGTQWVDPGYAGIDVPTQGRTVMLSIVQSL